MSNKIEPAAWMYPSDLEIFKIAETFAHAFSIEVGKAEEDSVPLYSAADIDQLQRENRELREALESVRKAGVVIPDYVDNKAKMLVSIAERATNKEPKP
jgi:hypothetical protein